MFDHLQTIVPGIRPWHRKLLVAAAIFTTILISLGGILCVTQSIRSCPDWPGCFGKILPPPEISPILEITHRLFAAISGALILGAAISGLIRARTQPWILWLPLITLLLVLEVSYFGARVVLYGLSPGWAAVDLGSALLVVAFMVMAAVIARFLASRSSISFKYRSPFARLSLVTTAIIYGVLVSGVLVAERNYLNGCLGWPIYNASISAIAPLMTSEIIRLFISIMGIGMILAVIIRSYQLRNYRPITYRLMRWTSFVVFLNGATQFLLFVFGQQISLLILYTVLGAVFWAFWVAAVVVTGLEENQITADPRV